MIRIAALVIYITVLSCHLKNEIKTNNSEFYKSVILYVDPDCDKVVLNTLVKADSLFYSHKLAQALSLYKSLEDSTSGTIISYIKFRYHETLQKLNLYEVIDIPIPQHTSINLSGNCKSIDSLFYFMDELTLYNDINFSQFFPIVERLINDPDINLYWKSKLNEIIGEYYNYETADQYNANKYLVIANSLFSNLPFYTHEILYIMKDLIQHSIGNRKYLIGRKLGEEMLEISQSAFPLDTALNAVSYQMSGYINRIAKEDESFISNYYKSLSYLNSSNKIKLKQVILNSFIYALNNRNKDDLVDSLRNELNFEMSATDTFNNIYKSLSEAAYNRKDFKSSIKYSHKALNYLSKIKRFQPGIYWTITSSLMECYRNIGLYNQSDQQVYDNLNFRNPTKCYSYKDILSGKADKGFYNFIIIGDLIKNLYERYTKSYHYNYLTLADSLISKANNLIDKENYSIEENRRVEMLRYSKEIYYIAMQVYFEMYKQKMSRKMLDSFYFYQEKTKGNILYADSKELREKFKIPDEITRKEIDLKAQIRSYRMNFTTQTVDELYKKYDQINEMYKKYYPEFYASRASGSIKPINELNIPDTVLFASYSIIDSNLYCMYIGDSVWAEKKNYKAIHSSLDTIIRYQRENLQENSSYWNNSIKVLNTLVNDNQLKNKRVFIFCPSGKLNFISFSGLILANSSNNIQVFNTFSGSTMNLEGIRLIDTGTTVAFSFSDFNTIRNPNLRLPELPGALKEANEIASMNSKNLIYTGMNANRNNLIKSYTSKSVNHLYLGLHGISNSDLRENIFLLLRTNKSDVFDTLRAHDLLKYSSTIPVIMLAACETAKGKEVEGEGEYNLVRYFKLNGAIIVYSSIWSLNDFFQYSQLIKYI